MDKNREIISELQNFFSSNTIDKPVIAVLTALGKITVRLKAIGVEKNPNCKFTIVQILKLVILFPFFSVKNSFRYAESGLGKLFQCKKDMFYRFMNNGDIDWRRILYSLVRHLLKFTQGDDAKGKQPRCMIIDDTDLPKRGKHTEGIGKVFSHTDMRSKLGFKAMFLCLTDGISQQMLDFTLQSEMGKNPDKPQGMSPKELAARKSHTRKENAPAETRKQEALATKIKNAKAMLRRAILMGISFDYLLVDSWFTCAEIVKFIHSRHIKCHFLGMAKMNNAKYKTKLGITNAPDIIKRLCANGNVKYSRSIGYHYAQLDATYAGIRVRLFFYRKGKSPWNALLTTDLKLDARKAFRLYSMRWCIEVAHKEMKQLLNLGKSQSTNFAGQIASISVTIIQYNILCYVKRKESYQTIGGLFAQISDQTTELTVAQKIWKLILEIVSVISEVVKCDTFQLLDAIVNGNENVRKLKRAVDQMKVAA